METVYRPDKDNKRAHKCYEFNLDKMVDKYEVSFHEVKRCHCGKLWIAVSRTYTNFWHMTPLRWYHRAYWKIDRSEA